MYSTCMFCNKPLGANEVLETFPVGRRLAFDSDRGRLWVVCTTCARWNLTPLEERWEAVEDCERLYRETRTRVSTENIGLARLREGLELVRIGRPVTGEFAAWRYGDQFGRRRKKAILVGAGVTVAFGAFVFGSFATGAAASGLLGQSGNSINLFVNGRTRVRFRDEEGKLVKLRGWDLQRARLLTPEQAGGEWELTVGRKGKERQYSGEPALRYAGKVLPGINAGGGSPKVVTAAVERIEEVGGPEAFLERGVSGTEYVRLGRSTKRKSGIISRVDKPTRLALEMALHEEQERRAMQGELWVLEAAWREAEEIAAISDNLLLPEGAEDFVADHRAAEGETPADPGPPADSGVR